MQQVTNPEEYIRLVPEAKENPLQGCETPFLLIYRKGLKKPLAIT